MKKRNVAQEILMSEIMKKVGGMVAMGMNRNTITYFLMTETGGVGWSGFDKVMFVGMVEQALDRMNVR